MGDFNESAGLYDNPLTPGEPEQQEPATKTAQQQLRDKEQYPMDFQQQFMDFLYNNQNAKFQELCGFAEKKTGLEREKLVYGLLALLAIYLVVAGNSAQFICNLIGFAYPAYKSVVAVRTKDTQDDTKWLCYWTVFGFLSMLDLAPYGLTQDVQIYWLLKVILLVYLALPETKAAEKIFRKYVDPAILYIELMFGKEMPILEPHNSLRQQN